MDAVTLYQEGQSIRAIAKIVRMSPATVYRKLKAAGVLRTKSEAQSLYLEGNEHQREGTEHSDDSRAKIRDSQREFWDSDEGKTAREKIAATRHDEWAAMSARERKNAIDKLARSNRPRRNELSSFGKAVYANLRQHGVKCVTNILLPQRRRLGILLTEDKIALDFPSREFAKPELLAKERDALKRAGIHLILVWNYSNSVSESRCDEARNQISRDIEEIHLK